MSTVASVLSRAEAALSRAGIDTPRLDAEVLLAAAMEAQRSALLASLRDPLDAGIGRRFAALLARRQQREPVARILGGREFWSLWFEVAPSTLIPRPETEMLVAATLDTLRSVERPSILDAGTGSGCIAIALACERPDARLIAIDVCEEALAVARRNAERHGVAERVQFLRADLRTFASPARFDWIASNPPYVRRSDIDTLQPEVRRFEPRAALDGGEDGLDIVRHLLARARELLTPGGGFAIEIGAGQDDDAVELARDAGFETATVRPDYAGVPRVLLAVSPTTALRSAPRRVTADVAGRA